MKPKHILVLTPAYPPFQGGGERYAHSLINSLADFGYRLTVVTSAAVAEPDFWQGSAAQEVTHTASDGVTVWRCPLAPLAGGRSRLLLWRKSMVIYSALPGSSAQWLSKMAGCIPPITGLIPLVESLIEDVDLVHGFNISWEHTLMAAWQTARKFRKPLVVTPFAHLGEGTQDRVALNSTMKHQLALMSAARAVTTMTTVETDGLAAYGVSRERLVTIGGGADPLPDPIPEPLSLPCDGLRAPLVVFIGRVSFDKGAHHAVLAVEKLRQQGHQVTFAVVGVVSDEFQRFFDQLADVTKTGVVLLGIVEEAFKHQLLQSSTMLVLPSRTDSFGLVLLEAWSYNKPVIGADTGGIPGVIDDEVNGLLVPYGDVTRLAGAIGRLLVEPELAGRLGNNGALKVSQDYSWNKVGQTVAAVYDRCVA